MRVKLVIDRIYDSGAHDEANMKIFENAHQIILRPQSYGIRIIAVMDDEEIEYEQ